MFIKLQQLTLFLVGVLFLCLITIPVAFTEEQGQKNMNSFSIPEQIDGWSSVDRKQRYNRDTIFNYMNGAGEMYLAYDFQELLVWEYSKPSAPSIIAEIYEMSSPEDAYGVFTNDTDGNMINMGQGAIYAQGLLRVWKGRFFIRLMAERETGETKTAIMKLGQAVIDSIAGEGHAPGLLRYLPPEGLLPGSTHYFHTQVTLNFLYFLGNTNILNLSSDTEAILARYWRAGSKTRLLLVGYPTSALAKTAFDQFNRIYLQKKSIPPGLMHIEKVENDEYVSASLSGRYLVLVFEAKDQSTCGWLSEAVINRIKGAQK